MRPEKESIVGEIRGYLEGAGYVVLADCRGLSVQQLSDLRGRLRESATRLSVVKNAFFSRAAESVGMGDVDRMLDGPTAMITGDGDITAVSRILREFVKEHGLPVAKGGVMGQRVLEAADVEQMASIPPREILLGKLVGTLAAPLTQLVGVMSQKVSSILYVLKAVESKKAETKQ